MSKYSKAIQEYIDNGTVINETYTINDVLTVGNPLDEGKKFKCVKCQGVGELVYCAPVRDWTCQHCGRWQQDE